MGGDENQEKDTARTTKKIKFPYNYRKQYVPSGLSGVERASREQGFVLDCVALAQISSDYSNANPKFGSAIPPYNSQKDPSVRNYFQRVDIEKVLIGSKQRDEENDKYLGESIAGKSADIFHEKGLGYTYLSLRNNCGAGRDRGTWSGHGDFMSDTKDIPGFNGQFGYRRNTPMLRQYPSVFGLMAPTSSGY